MPKLSQVGALYRYHVIDDMLKYGGKKTVKQIIKALGGEEKITDKMIRNDFESMYNLFGAKIIPDNLHRFTYEDTTFSIKSFPINEDDAIMLELASINFQNLFTSNVTQKYNSAISKVLKGYDSTSENINENLKVEIANLQIIQPEISHSKIGYQWIEPIFDSILKKNAIEIVYQKFGEDPQKKILSPYLLKEFRNHWYLVAYDHLSSNLTKVYALDRINDLDISETKYYIDTYFDINNYFKYTYGIFHLYKEQPKEIILEFYNKMAQQVLNHPLTSNQKSSLSPDRKTLTVKIEVYESGEITREILGYGASVKVISPKELADKIVLINQKTISLYK